MMAELAGRVAALTFAAGVVVAISMSSADIASAQPGDSGGQGSSDTSNSAGASPGGQKKSENEPGEPKSKADVDKADADKESADKDTTQDGGNVGGDGSETEAADESSPTPPVVEDPTIVDPTIDAGSEPPLVDPKVPSNEPRDSSIDETAKKSDPDVEESGGGDVDLGGESDLDAGPDFDAGANAATFSAARVAAGAEDSEVITLSLDASVFDLGTQLQPMLAAADVDVATSSTSTTEIVDPVGAFFASLFAPLAAPGPEAPNDNPLGWALLGLFRRQQEQELVSPQVAAVTPQISAVTPQITAPISDEERAFETAIDSLTYIPVVGSIASAFALVNDFGQLVTAVLRGDFVDVQDEIGDIIEDVVGLVPLGRLVSPLVRSASISVLNGGLINTGSLLVSLVLGALSGGVPVTVPGQPVLNLDVVTPMPPLDPREQIFTAIDPEFNELIVDRAGNVWFGYPAGGYIGRLDPDGNLKIYEIPMDAPGLIIPNNPFNSGPSYLAEATDGKIWMSFYLTGQIGILDPTKPDGNIRFFPTPILIPHGIAPDIDGNMWVVAGGQNGIVKITQRENGDIGPLEGEFTSYDTRGLVGIIINDIVAGPPGDARSMWFTETFSGRIGRVDIDTGEITEYRVDSAPYGIVLGPDGNFWFNDAFGTSIGKITPQGEVTLYPIPGGANLLGLTTIASDGTNLWFGSRDRMGRIDPKTGKITIYGLSRSVAPYFIAAGPNSEKVYFGNFPVPFIQPAFISSFEIPEDEMV